TTKEGAATENADKPAPEKKPEPKKAEDSSENKSLRFLWGIFDLPSWLLLGGSVRLANIWDTDNGYRFFPMQLDAYGGLHLGAFRAEGSIGLAKVPANSPNARAAQVTHAQDKSYNLISRTHWLAWDFMNQALTV